MVRVVVHRHHHQFLQRLQLIRQIYLYSTFHSDFSQLKRRTSSILIIDI